MWKSPEKLSGILLMEQKEDESGSLDTRKTVFMTNGNSIIFKSEKA